MKKVDIFILILIVYLGCKDIFPESVQTHDSLVHNNHITTQTNEKKSDNTISYNCDIEVTGYLISISGILITLLLAIFGGNYILSVGKIKRSIIKLSKDTAKLNSDARHLHSRSINYFKTVEKDFKQLIDLKESVRDIVQTLKNITSTQDENKIQIEISNLENKMNQIQSDFQINYKTRYLMALSDSEPEEVLRAVLIAIRNSNMIEAIPQINKLLKSKKISKNLTDFAQEVIKYLESNIN